MATFPVDIVISTPGAQQLAPLNRQLDQTDRAATGAATAVNALAAAAAAIGVGSAVKNAISVNRDFNKSISELSAITGATGRDLQFLTQASKEFGATTTLSASQAATAFKLIASAKPDLLSNAEALKAVTGEAIALAEAAGIDLPAAANALGNALNQFGADASEAGRFINVLAAGAKFGSSSIAETSEALKNAGVSAANAKLSFEQTNAAIQALATSGLRGAEAGTGLRNVLTILDTSADKSLRPSIVGLAGALDELASRQLDNTEFVKLFGRENQNAARILLNQRENFKGLTDALTGTNTAYEQARTRVDNLNGDLLALASAFEGVQIEAAQLADGGLRKVTQALTAGLQGLNENPERIAAALETLGVAATAVAAVLAGRVVSSAGAAAAAFVTKTAAAVAASQAEKELAVTEAAAAAARADNAAITAATNKAAAAENAARLRSSLAAIDAEIALEKVRSAAQISERGRIDSATRFAELGKTRLALTGQLAAADALVTKTTTEATAANVAATQSNIALSAAQRATAGTSTALAVAMGALSRTMSFLGGPVGVILLAATAFTVFNSKAKDAKDATELLNLELSTLSRNQAIVALRKVEEELARLQKESLETERTIAKLNESLNLGSAVTGADDAATRKALEDYNAGLDETERSIRQFKDRQQELRDEISGLNADLEFLDKNNKKVAVSTDTSSEAVSKASESYEKLYEQLRLGIILTQQTERQAAVTTALSKLAADATDQERAATAALAAQLFDLTEARRESEATEQQRAAIDSNITALQQQLVALNLTGEAQAVYSASTRLGAEATEQQRAAVEALTAAIYQRQEALRAEQTLTQFDQSLESPVERIEREAQLVREANLRALEAGVQDLQQYKDREAAIDRKAAADKLRLTQQSQSAIRVATAQGLDALAGIVEAAGSKQTKAYRAIYAASRAFALADSIAKVTQATAQALADPTAVTLPQKFANYAAVATAGAGLISALKPQQFADGGMVSGAGTGRSDSIPAWLSNGEYVMTAQRTAQYRSELDAMRRGTFNANSGTTAAPRVTIINNVSDMATTTVTEGPDGELIATIDRRIAESVPGIVEQQLSDPYSGSTRQLNSAYRLERR